MYEGFGKPSAMQVRMTSVAFSRVNSVAFSLLRRLILFKVLAACTSDELVPDIVILTFETPSVKIKA